MRQSNNPTRKVFRLMYFVRFSLYFTERSNGRGTGKIISVSSYCSGTPDTQPSDPLRPPPRHDPKVRTDCLSTLVSTSSLPLYPSAASLATWGLVQLIRKKQHYLSTCDVLLVLIHDWRTSLHEEHNPRVVSFEFRSAFHMVNHTTLLFKVILTGVGGLVFDINL